MTGDERYEIIERFRSGQTNIVFATNAFGLGIDIPDIRVIIHFMIPESTEQYYQEIGRASRDRSGAIAYLLYSDKNISVKREFFIERSFPNEKDLTDAYDKVTAGETGIKTLQYFDDEEIQKSLAYFLDFGLIEITGKGFSSLKPIKKADNPVIAKYIDATKTKGLISTVKKLNISASDIIDAVYDGLIDNKIKLSSQLDHILVLKIN